MGAPHTLAKKQDPLIGDTLISISLLHFLAFALSTSAFAGGGRDDSSIPVYSDHSSDRPVMTEAIPERDGIEPFQVEFLGSEGSMRGVTEYDFAVGREVYTASYGTIRGEGVFSLYGERGELIFGYVVDGDGLRIFDRSTHGLHAQRCSAD